MSEVKPIVFLHIPKTGGSAFKKHLHSSKYEGGVGNRVYTFKNDKEWYEWNTETGSFNNSKMSYHSLFYAHLDFYSYANPIPKNLVNRKNIYHNKRFFTLLRNPLNRIPS